MILPTELLSIAAVTKAKAGHFLKAIDRDGAAMWVMAAEGYMFAVFLTGEHAGRAFEIKPDSGGFACAVGPVEVRVDPSSVSNESSDWSLKAIGGLLHLGFQAEKFAGSPEHLWAPVADFEVGDERQLFFGKWAAGVVVDGEWVELVSVVDGQLTTALNVVA